MRFRVRIALTVVLTCVPCALLAPSARATAQIASFFAANCKVETCKKHATEKEELEHAETEGFTQAGGHPPFGITDFTVATTGTAPNAIPTGVVTHVRTDVAPGLATNPLAVPECAPSKFGKEVGKGVFTEPECPESEIGINEVEVYAGVDVPLKGKVYNLEPNVSYGTEPPPRPRSSNFGVALDLEPLLGAGKNLYAHSYIEGNVEWGSEAEGTGKADYHDYFEIKVSPELPLIRSRLTFIGTKGGDFITNPTSFPACPGLGPRSTTTLTLKFESGETTRAAYTTPIGTTGCEKVGFEPGFSLMQTTTALEAPDGITAEISLHHNTGAAEIDDSQVKYASIALPPGITLNPSAAAGLEACTPEEVGIGTTTPVNCPEGSRLGTVSLNVPGLPEGSLQGYVYLGSPAPGPITGPPYSASGAITGPPYVTYVVAESKRYGVSVRLRGLTTPNEATGQLTTRFTENPEQPFDSLALHFNGGPLAPLANELRCEAAAASTTFTPFSGNPALSLAAPFEIGGCPATLPFSIAQSTGGEPKSAGSHTSYTFTLVRTSGEQYLQKIKTTLPAGLAGAIPDVTLCEEPQAAAGTCAAASRIGTATVTAGAGSAPFTFSGPVYMTGPYGGAPFGLSVAVPAVAGPFDLGTVVTRAAISVDPLTSRVTAESTLPTIVKGVPLRLRSVKVEVNRQGFLFNPTNCELEFTQTTLTSTFDALQEGLSSPFQAEGCSSLAFKPTFNASTSGKPTKAGGASLLTTITQSAGEANIKGVFVTLPLQLPSRLSTLNKSCLAATFNANPASCPAESRVGTASAVTPLLPGTMTGTAFYISHGGEEFPDLDIVLEGDGVRTILVGNTKITRGITTTNFAATPDVPVSSFTLDLPMGRYSALAANGNLCVAKLVMPTLITAQNGKQIKQNTIIKPTGCGVQIIAQKVLGPTASITVKTFEAGRISVSGSDLGTVTRALSSASGAAKLKVSLSRTGRARSRPFSVRVRVAFQPKSRKGKSSQAFVTVRFR